MRYVYIYIYIHVYIERYIDTYLCTYIEGYIERYRDICIYRQRQDRQTLKRHPLETLITV